MSASDQRGLEQDWLGDNLGSESGTLSSAYLPRNRELPMRRVEILVACVSVINRFSIKAYLNPTEFVIRDADDALDTLKLGTYDLALLEPDSPWVDKYEAIRVLRRLEVQRGLPHAPLIALIAASSLNHKRQISVADYDDYITTPISKRTLLTAIRAWSSPVDRVAIEELRGLDTPGDESVLRTLITQFLHDLDSRLASIRGALLARDVQLAAHTLRGSCGHFGAHRMARLCARLERGTGQLNAEVVAELEIEAQHVRHALKADLERFDLGVSPNPRPPLEANIFK
jgi:two-component system, sensor histidine kinase and response regulator